MHIYTQNDFENILAQGLKILHMNHKTLEGTLLRTSLAFAVLNSVG